MPLIGDLNTFDEVSGISFGDRASIMAPNWTRTSVSNSGNRNTVDCVMLGCYIDNFAAVTGAIAETDNVWHD
jgi:predicted transcriptional regulator